MMRLSVSEGLQLLKFLSMGMISLLRKPHLLPSSILAVIQYVIIHVGSNGAKQDAVTKNSDRACGKLREINPNIEVAVSSIFLHKYDTTKNFQIIETNAALEQYCLLNGFDFLNNSNIAFKHLDKWGHASYSGGLFWFA